MKNTSEKLKETDLYKPVYSYLTAQGYTVRSEVKNCDITAIKGEELVVVELKCSMNLTLLIQATQRQKAADSVYVAIPKPKRGMRSTNWKHTCHLLRRLELGLIVVSPGKGKSGVEVVFHPSPFDQAKSRQQSKHTRNSIIREMSARYGDFNEGGSTGRKIMTAYRENSIYIACCLEKLGPLSPRKLRELGTGDKTPSILSKNFYRWFERLGRGIYTLSPKGLNCFQEYPELAQHYRCEVEKKLSANN
ncbi:MAG: DUF2161 family putative PD-(D/E)XK-type phosphodiesterase [Clostridia bacterium]|nr:DUF2161 family putative PD-(D/E)XK-type phosphodiesterase [Clostridia bacterium]